MSGKIRKWHKIVGRSKKSSLDSKAKFNYVNKDDPSYRRYCAATYTEKQLMLLSGETPWETTPLHQLTNLLYKAETLNDTKAYKRAKELRDLKLKQRENRYTPDLSVEEAKDTLRALTPWETRSTDSGGVVQGAV